MWYPKSFLGEELGEDAIQGAYMRCILQNEKNSQE